MERVVEKVRSRWAKGDGVAPEVVHPEGLHRFAPEQRERAYQILEEAFR